MKNFIIDGYNLFHLLGYAIRGQSHEQFENARKRMLQWLNERINDREWNLHIIFDAQKSKRQRYENSGKIFVEFALGDTADNRISQVVRQLAKPREWAVVSSDLQVRENAFAAECLIYTCPEWLDLLDKPEKVIPPSGTAIEEKPSLIPGLNEELLSVFEQRQSKRKK